MDDLHPAADPENFIELSEGFLDGPLYDGTPSNPAHTAKAGLKGSETSNLNTATPLDELSADVRNRYKAARRFHDNGDVVIPLAPGTKDKPLVKGWQDRAPDWSDVERMLRTPNGDGLFPNYGIRCDVPAIDTDNGEKNGRPRHGEANLLALAKKHGGMPETFTVATPSGGFHRRYTTPFPVTNSHGLPLYVDVRGCRGYVVGPLSELVAGYCKDSDTPGIYQHVSGKLNEVPEAPDWMLERLTRYDPNAKADPADRAKIARGNWQIAGDPTPLDVFTEAASWIDFTMREDQERWVGMAKAVLYNQLNIMTKEEGVWRRISDEESRDLCHVIMSGRGWGERIGDPSFVFETYGDGATLESRLSDGPSRITGAIGIGTFYQMAEEQSGGAFNPPSSAKRVPMIERAYGAGTLPVVDDNSDDISSIDDAPDKQDIANHIFTLDGFLDAVQPREFAIDRWLPAKGVSYILAKRGTGKSAVLTDLACRIATGHDWHGVEVDKERAVVVYLCGEDDDGLALNLRAWQTEHLECDEEIDPSRLIVSDRVMQLKNMSEVDTWAKVLKAQIGDRKAIVIMDTWQRATSSAKSQSEESDISAAFANAEYLLDKLDAPGLFSAHPAKAVKHEDDLSVMGTSIAENQAVAIWTLWDTDTDPSADQSIGLRLRVAKVRGARKGAYHLMRLREVPLAGTENNFGREFEGVVVDHVGGVADPDDTEAKRREQEREHDIKAVYAEMVLHLHQWGGTDACFRRYGSGGFKRTHIGFAEEAARQMKEDDSYLKTMWAQSAKDAGVVAFGASTIRRALAKYFKPGLRRPATYDFEDGETRLTVTRKGKTTRAECYYQIGRNPLAGKNPGRGED